MEETFGIGMAVKEMMDGKKCRRLGWNGQNQWVCYMPPTVITESLVNARTRRFIPYGPLNVGGYFVIKTEHGVWQPGWLASTSDLAALDWCIVK